MCSRSLCPFGSQSGEPGHSTGWVPRHLKSAKGFASGRGVSLLDSEDGGDAGAAPAGGKHAQYKARVRLPDCSGHFSLIGVSPSLDARVSIVK